MADKEGLEACIRAKEEGAPVYVETCPQYLEFTCDVYKREDGRNFVCSPPMKGQESLDALWEAIKDGFIDTIATDHCPFQSYEKDWGKDDFTKIPNGCAGVENMYPYMLDAANSGKITFEKVVELCSAIRQRFSDAQIKVLLASEKMQILLFMIKTKISRFLYPICIPIVTIPSGKAKNCMAIRYRHTSEENLCTITVNLSEHRVWDNILSVNQENNRNCRYMCKT